MRTSYLRLLLRHGALMQTIASVMLVTFTWLLIHPTALAAKTLADRRCSRKFSARPLAIAGPFKSGWFFNRSQVLLLRRRLLSR